LKTSKARNKISQNDADQCPDAYPCQGDGNLKKIPALLYKRLNAIYGDLAWWPAKTPYEVIVGAILTQNTAWTNVQKALANFEGRLEPAFVAVAEIETLIKIIRPAGFFNQKALYLKAVTRWFESYHYDPSAVHASGLQDISGLRKELLEIKGVGRETADSILLYAFGLPVFVVDAYTQRILNRISGGTAPNEYETIRKLFESALPTDCFNNMHALIVQHAKDSCRKKPFCTECALAN
jgi:endonuclease-3 related protein